jgi:ketosteroid isomerase-like protein
MSPITGSEAIIRFWFPSSGPSTRVTAMDMSIDDLRIDGDLAVVSGHGSLTYVIHTSGKQSEPRTLKSWFVNVLRRQPDARWLIARRAWSDLR